MLSNLRRKVGMGSGINTPMPTMMPPPGVADMVVSPTFIDPSMPAPFTMEELGFAWPGDRGIVSPSVIPVWLQEQVRAFPPYVPLPFHGFNCLLFCAESH